MTDGPGARRGASWGIRLLLALLFVSGLVVPLFFPHDHPLRLAGLGVCLLALVILVAMVYAGGNERG